MLYVWQEFFSSAVDPVVVVAADCMELPFKDLVAVWEVAVALRQKTRRLTMNHNDEWNQIDNGTHIITILCLLHRS